MYRLIIDLIFIVFGILIILGRTQIAKIFTDYATKNALKYTIFQQKSLFVILWLIGLVFIFGSVFQIIKTFIK
jgi:peptidoglycan biosynthesis protein MviN/MurJ (putative lipid II flippase)